MYLLISNLTIINAQKNEIRIQLNHLFFYNSNEFSDLEGFELIETPEENDNVSNYEVGLTYLRKLEKVKWLLFLGLRKIDQKGDDVRVSDNSYSKVKNSQKENSYIISCGLESPISNWKNKKFISNISVLGQFRFDQYARIEYLSESFNSQDQLMMAYNVIYKFPKSWQAGLNFKIGAFYYFFNKIGIGAEVSNLFYIDIQNGVTNINHTFYDEDYNISDQLIVNQSENKRIIGKSSSNISFVLSFKF